MKSPYLRWAAFIFALFHIYSNVFASISELWLSAIHFGGFSAICALTVNESRGVRQFTTRYWVNIALAITAAITSAYLVLFENALYARETEYILSDYVFSILGLGLAIEFTRRTSGWFMPILILFSMPLPLPFPMLPPNISGPGLSTLVRCPSIQPQIHVCVCVFFNLDLDLGIKAPRPVPIAFA